MNKDLPKNTDENGRDENGRFTDGNKGKPRGATNKTTRDLRKFITNFLNEKTFEIEHIWNAMDDKEKATLFLHLCKLVLPKPTDENDLSNSWGALSTNWYEDDNEPNLTTEQVNRLIDKL